MNVDFFAYDKNGVIVRTGNCPEAYVHIQPEEHGETVRFGSASPDVNYYDLVEDHLALYTPLELQAKNNMRPGRIWKMPERVVIDTRELADAKNEAWTRIKKERDEAETGTFKHDGAVYQIDTVRIPNAGLNAAMAELAGTDYREEWTLADNSVKVLDAAAMIALSAAQAAYISKVHKAGRGMRELIFSSNVTIPELDLMVWPDVS